ncbi:MAG: AlpA family transcriptional regulator [Betaproteobacteria bacterium]|nr:AlpA family transcriptional regulator [Betaproteobacteria bacterium]
MNKQANQTPAFLRRREVLRRTGIGNTTLYKRINAGAFPRPVSIGGNLVAWVESEVTDWMQARIDESRKAA